MRWAFLFLLLAVTAQAADEPIPAACAPWYARLGRSVKESVVGTGRKAKASFVELKENVRQEGPLRIFVRQRTEEEKALGYRSYFIAPPPEASPPKNLLTKAWAQLRRLNPLRKYAPSRGLVQSADRLILRDRTATNGIRGAAVLATGTGAAIVLTDQLYERPMAYLEEKIPFERAAREGLDHEFAFEKLRSELASGKITREAAEEKVREEYHARKRYFDLVSLELAASGAKEMEEIAPKFIPYINAKELGSSMSDLRYFASGAYRAGKNVVVQSEAKITPEQFGRLFALNHFKVYAAASLTNWMQPDFKPGSLPENSSARMIYETITEDPFRKQLIALQKARPDKVPLNRLTAWLSEDFAWEMRLAELDTVNAGLRAKEGESRTLTLADRREEFMKKNGISMGPSARAP